MKKSRGWAVALLVVVILVVALSFPAVRAVANDFLGMFRVEKFATVSISPEQIAMLEELEASGLTPGEFVVLEEPGEFVPADSLTEAEMNTGLELKTLEKLGEPEEVNVVDGGRGYFAIDLEGVRAIMEFVGVDPAAMPDTIRGNNVYVTVYPSVEQFWPDGTHLMQTPSPMVNYPEEIDPTIIGEAFLRVLGKDADEAKRIAQSIDWTSTMLLPVPTDVVDVNEVEINGVAGVAIHSLEGDGNAIMWQNHGMIYVLTGDNISKLVSLANNLE